MSKSLKFSNSAGETRNIYETRNILPFHFNKTHSKSFVITFPAILAQQVNKLYHIKSTWRQIGKWKNMIAGMVNWTE